MIAPSVTLTELQLKEARKAYDEATARYQVILTVSIAAIVLGVYLGRLFGMTLVRGIRSGNQVAASAGSR